MRLQPARHVTAVAALAAMLYWLWDAAGYAAERLLFEDFEETDNVVGRVWTHYAEQFAGSADRWQVAGFAQSGSYCVASMDPNELDNQGDSILRFNIGLNWGQEMFIRYHARFPADWEAEATDYNNGGHGPDGGSNHFRMEGEDNRDIEATFGGGWLHGGSFHWYDSGVRWDSGRLYVYDNAWHEYALYIKMPSSPTASNGMFRAWRDGAGTYAANAVLAYTGMQQTTVFTRVSVGSPCYYKGPVRPTQVDGKQSSGNWRFWIDSYEVWNGIPSEPPPPVTPAAPSELNAVPVSSSKIELTWRDNSSDETGFKIDRRQSGQSGWARVAEPAANVTAHPDSGLPADTTFYYIVKACNAAGNSAYSDLAWATTERAAPSTIVIPAGATWRYRKGTAEASEPSTAWRRPGFDDSSWSSGPAPIGYSDYGVTLGTELADMPNSYSCIFLRSGFSVRYSALVSELHILAQFDDSFIMWINGEEIARVNAPGAPGEPVPHDAIALNNMNASWSNTYAGAAMPVLCPTNVLAVQVFNRSLTSGDCLFDAALSWTVSRLSLEKDADQNGMPDAWETACLSVLPDPSGRTAAADPDEDGLSNLEEWICGSDPTSDSSVFALDVGMTPAGPVVRFTALPAAGTGYGGYTRYYTLEARSFAADTTWQPVLPFTNIAAAGQVVACTNAVAGTPQCYRGRVWLERPQ